MKSLISRAALASALAFIPAYASAQEAGEDDPIVVTATRTPTELSKVGSSISVITADDMERQQTRFVSDVLQTVPGVFFKQSGPRGAQSTVGLRGQSADGVVVLVDGVEVSDTAGTQNAFDFAQLLSSGYDRIEVLRGAQSVLYGSEAVGGVINITTQRGEGQAGGDAFVEGGSYDTFTLGARVRGGLAGDRIGYSANLQGYRTDGFSAADEDRPGNIEADGYDNVSGSGRLDFKVSDALSLRAVGRYTDGSLDYDTFGPKDNAGPSQDFTQYSLRGSGEFSFFDGFFTGSVGAAYSKNERTTFNFGALSGRFRGDRTKYDLQGNLNFSQDDVLVFGVEAEDEEASTSGIQNKSASLDSVYASYQTGFFDRLYIALGARLDDSDTFGDFDSYRASVSYLIEGGVRAKASYATGFRAPSLNERFGLFGGNPNLTPEENESWDAGFEFATSDRAIVADVTYFSSETENEIIFVGFLGPYLNAGGTTDSRGVETSIEWSITGALSLGLAYTYNDVDGDLAALAYRPRHVTNLNVNYSFAGDRANLNLNVRGVADRRPSEFDADPDSFDPITRDLEAYTVVNLGGSYDLTENLQVYGRIENLTDEQYQTTYGYGTADRSVYVGLRVGF